MTTGWKGRRRNTVTDWTKKEIARKITIHTGRLMPNGPGASPARQVKK